MVVGGGGGITEGLTDPRKGGGKDFRGEQLRVWGQLVARGLQRDWSAACPRCPAAAAGAGTKVQ